MTHHELTIFFLAIAVLLMFAQILGEIAKAFNQPSVLGEIMAGVLLGPTVLGYLAPDVQQWLFPETGNFPVALEAITSLAIVMFLLVAGLEVDLSAVLRQGRSSIIISFFGMVVPFGVGFVCAWFAPLLFGFEQNNNHNTVFIFSLFLGTALAISALPVIAKTLLDLNIYRTDFGMVVISVAVVDDLTGWMLFAIILGMLDAGGAYRPMGVEATIALTIFFTFFVLSVGRLAIDRVLPHIQAYTTWPGGVLSFAMVGAMLCAAFTEWIGVHAIFGAFLFGVALGDSRHLRARTRHTLENFISFIFAPLFFASIGLRVDFIANFDLMLVLAVIFIASVGKLLGCGLASRIAGFNWRESWAIGVGMNARGGMGIILALLAQQAGLIGDRMFVALVVMSVFTAMIAGGLMQKLLQQPKVKRFFDFIPSGGFIPSLQAHTREEAIRELAAVAAKGAPTDVTADAVADAVWKREQVFSTGIGHGLAVPHARIDGLKAPVVAMGLARKGIDFDSPDGEPARIIFLILTPKENSQSQLEILGEIGRAFSDKDLRDNVARCPSYVEFIAAMKSLH